MMRLAAALFLGSACALTPACGAETQEPSPAPAKPASHSWSVDYGKSALSFTATQTGTAFTGRFRKFEAAIVFDPDDLSSATIDVSIDMASAETGDRQRDIALPEKDWFDAKSHPTASFVSRNVEATGAGAYVAHGTLTIRDASKSVDLPFNLTIDGNVAHATGGVTLIRTDFGVGEGDFASDEWVGFNVDVNVDISATR